jgi:uncharacterized BrkB/YihY/UPF0761 family membrane protein
MTVRRRRPRSPDRVDRGAAPDNAGDNSAGDSADGTGLVRFAAATRGRVTRAQQWLAKYQGIPVVDVVLATFRKDRRAAGSVVSSALAFRLFLFFLPLLLLTIGVAGFASEVVDARSVDRAAGIHGGVAKQVITAFHESGLTRWVAVLLGLWGVLVAGRSLSRVLYAASAAAWGLPAGNQARLRAVGAVAGIVGTIGVIAIIIGRIRESFGIGPASASFLPALLIYAIAWLGILMFLPRATEDPGALLPGCLLIALTLTVMQAVSELYLPDRIGHASQLYGTLGTTVVTLGWFFILGRAIIIAMELNAAIYDRYGSISQVVFSLPVLRTLARRSPRIRRFFGLTDASD